MFEFDMKYWLIMGVGGGMIYVYIWVWNEIIVLVNLIVMLDFVVKKYWIKIILKGIYEM